MAWRSRRPDSGLRTCSFWNDPKLNLPNTSIRSQANPSDHENSRGPPRARSTGSPPRAAPRTEIRRLLERPEAQLAEYFDPFTGEPLGSREQSWTAAVTIDWLAR